MDLPVKVVKQRCDSPELPVLSKLVGVRGHAGFYAQNVPPEIFAFNELANNIPGLISRHPGASRLLDLYRIQRVALFYRIHYVLSGTDLAKNCMFSVQPLGCDVCDEKLTPVCIWSCVSHG
jgi:hypothetical protein